MPLFKPITMVNFRLPTSDFRLPTSDFRLPTSDLLALTLLFLFAMLAPPLFSQNLLTEVNVNSVTLDSDDSTRLDKHTDTTFSLSTKIVQMGLLTDNMQAGIVSFTIPGVQDTFAAETVIFEYTDSVNYSWSANIEDGAGHIIIEARDSHYVGLVQSSHGYYSLDYLNKGHNVLVEHDLTAYADSTHACATENGGPGPTGPCDLKYNTCPAMIHILLLITPQAEEDLVEISGGNGLVAALYVALGVHTVNFAFFNSDIPNKNVRYSTISFSMPLDNVIADDLIYLIDSTGVDSIRNAHKADMVVMLTDVRYLAAAGVANCIGNTGPDCGYAIVEAKKLIEPSFTFAHEIGHLLGARHQRGEDDTDICSHAYVVPLSSPNLDTVYENVDYFTVVGSKEEHYILHYSNPDIEVEGYPTGTADNNNAKTIRNTACGWANVYDSGEMLVGIDGPSTVCNIESETYFANVTPANTGTPGQAPFTYEWRWNTTGVFVPNSLLTPGNPGTYLGNASYVTIGNLSCPHFYLYLKVTSSDGVIVTRIRKIITKYCDECDDSQSGLIAPPKGTAYLGSYTAVVVPNPATDRAVLSVSSASSGILSYSLTNLQGQMLYQSSDWAIDVGDNKIEVPIDQLPSGIYFCTVQLAGEQSIIKMVVEK